MHTIKYLFILIKIIEMERLHLSNRCLNCLNLKEAINTCSIRELKVAEKYTCANFNGF